MNLPRVCIVGAGSLSTKRIYPNIGTAGAQIAGVCDLDRARAENNAARWGGTVYGEMNGMLDREKPDGVIICINSILHAQLAVEVLRRKIPVYIEKPPAPDGPTALKTARAAKEAGVLCMTAFKKRYTTAYERARAFIDEFAAEKRLALSIDYSSGKFPNTTMLRTFIHDFAVHAIDLSRWLFGDVKRVVCFAKGKDAYAVSMEYACGAVGSLCFTDGRGGNAATEEVEITLEGGNYMTVHNSSCWRMVKDGKACEWREPLTYISAGDSGHDTGHLPELVEFVTAIREKRTTCRSDAADSYRSMVLYDAICASAESGKVVELAYETI